MASIARAALSEVDTQLAKQVSARLADIRVQGSLEAGGASTQHRPRLALPETKREEEADSNSDDPTWMYIGHGWDGEGDFTTDVSDSTLSGGHDDDDGIDIV